MKTSSFLALLLILQSASAQNAPVPPPKPLPPPVALPAPPPPTEDDVVIEQRISGAAPRRVRASQAGIEALSASGAALAIRDYNGSTKPSRCLVVQFNATDAEALSRAEEDLAIMARILDKAARTRQEERFMGITVDGSVFGSSSGARNIYVEGQGALFLLSVKYPLIAPPEKSPELKAKDPTSDEWKRAREEVTGGGGGDSAQFFEYAIPRDSGPAEDFDEDKVNELKDALIGALKNATHLRMVKPDEFITVVVQGADSTPATVTKTTRDGKAGVRVNVTTRAGLGGNTRRSESVLTLRVKKSDADAYASGKLDLDTFRKKVSTQSYLRRPFASAVPDMFNLPGVRQ